MALRSFNRALGYKLVICILIHFTFATAPSNQELCTPELETRFLPKDGKCLHSGLLPVKGSCTAYIPCISFGSDLMKPMLQLECRKSSGFDIEHSRCRLVQSIKQCLQRDCYPEESNLADGLVFSDAATEGSHFGNAQQDEEKRMEIRPHSENHNQTNRDTVSSSSTLRCTKLFTSIQNCKFSMLVATLLLFIH